MVATVPERGRRPTDYCRSPGRSGARVTRQQSGGGMRLYWEVARRSFRRWSTYRGATIAGAITNSVFGYIRAYVLLAVYEHRSDVGGFDAVDAVTFSFVSQGFLMLVSVFRTEMGLSERVRSGEVA